MTALKDKIRQLTFDFDTATVTGVKSIATGVIPIDLVYRVLSKGANTEGSKERITQIIKSAKMHSITPTIEKAVKDVYGLGGSHYACKVTPTKSIAQDIGYSSSGKGLEIEWFDGLERKETLLSWHTVCETIAIQIAYGNY